MKLRNEETWRLNFPSASATLRGSEGSDPREIAILDDCLTTDLLEVWGNDGICRTPAGGKTLVMPQTQFSTECIRELSTLN